MAITDYGYKRKITIDHNVVDSTETDYPAMVKFYEDSSVSAWSSSTTYAVDDVVTNDGAYFKCLTASTSKEPRVTTDWQDDWQYLGEEFDFSNVETTGYDFRFYASDESTELDCERELFDLQLAYEGLSFDGVDDYINCGNDSSLQLTSDFSVECTIITKQLNSSQNVLTKWNDANNKGWGIRISNGNKIQAAFRDEGSNYYGIESSTNVGLNQSYKIKFYYKGDGTAPKLWINDIEETTSVFLSDGDVLNGLSDSGESLEIGRGNIFSGTKTYFKGVITNSKIWSGNELTLISEYLFDEGTGTTLTDNEGTNDGTINGATWVDENAKNQAIFHVCIPSVSSSTDTDYYMYYGYADATDGENATGVWDSNFVMVQHMGDSLLDSTSNGNDGTNYGSTVVDGLNGNARSFDGSNDYINCGVVGNIGDAISLQIFANYSSFGFLFGNYDPDYKWAMIYNNKFSVDDGVTKQDSSFTETLSVWNHIIGTFDGSNQKVYKNGTQEGGTLSGTYTSIQSINPIIIGKSADSNANYTEGIIDEVRISNIARSDAWIKMDDANLRTWSLQSVGVEEEAGITVEPNTITSNTVVNNVTISVGTVTLQPNTIISNTVVSDVNIALAQTLEPNTILSNTLVPVINISYGQVLQIDTILSNTIVNDVIFRYWRNQESISTSWTDEDNPNTIWTNYSDTTTTWTDET